MKARLGLVLATFAFSVHGQTPSLHNAQNRDGTVVLKDMNLTLPAGWTLVQDALSGGTTILGLAKGDEYVTLFARPQSGAPGLNGMYTTDTTGSSTTNENFGPLSWQARDTSHQTKDSRGDTYYVHGFQTPFAGYVYSGFARGSSADAARQAASEIMSTLRVPLRGSRSLTGASYQGHKYYLGWGTTAGGESNNEMENEVKYDVKHTDAIFSKEAGGNYGDSMLIDDQASRSAITDAWSKLTHQMTGDDMFIQYSSGHGYDGGLGVGVDYQQMRDTLLAMPAREIIVFTMACESGSLVEAFNERKSDWQNWQAQGRTLFVFTSSRAGQSSNTGPGTDPDEPAGVEGSAGSAFGFALWKALSGEADGFIDGVKDGFLSLEEIRGYTIWRTQQVANQNPVATGSYYGPLIMNQVPSKALIEQLEREGGTRGLTDTEIRDRIARLDRELAVH